MTLTASTAIGVFRWVYQRLWAERQGLVKLADFGVATRLTEADVNTHFVVRTLYLMAPEATGPFIRICEPYCFPELQGRGSLRAWNHLWSYPVEFEKNSHEKRSFE
ncbi:hypothetical protein PHJA_002455100 [Phtheirospermum japonicum]|uniref:Protein kinase domain-containing protein n=1 Tax=Phtheirospermum japonicum TaxID=374723 RepID=A0A830CXV0_9LAMI|nr:hypothetical protein PHJA_002455100 [Phtheirospermum japonicum]